MQIPHPHNHDFVPYDGQPISAEQEAAIVGERQKNGNCMMYVCRYPHCNTVRVTSLNFTPLPGADDKMMHEMMVK